MKKLITNFVIIFYFCLISACSKHFTPGIYYSNVGWHTGVGASIMEFKKDHEYFIPGVGKRGVWEYSKGKLYVYSPEFKSKSRLERENLERKNVKPVPNDASEMEIAEYIEKAFPSNAQVTDQDSFDLYVLKRKGLYPVFTQGINKSYYFIRITDSLILKRLMPEYRRYFYKD